MKKIKRYFIGLLLTFMSISAYAQDTDVGAFNALTIAVSKSVETFYSDYLGWFEGVIFTSVSVGRTGLPSFVGWLVIAAAIFKVYFGQNIIDI